MGPLPEQLRLDVIREVYRRADELDWVGLSDRQRTVIYDRWLDEPAIGGKLSLFLPRERARVWLKDVPMKEYARACNGIGPLADLVWSRLPGPGQIARQVLSEDWDAIEGSIEEKPIRCLISDRYQERLMIWGPPETLRDMVWRGIIATADHEPVPLLVVAFSYGHSLDDGEKRRNVLLGKIAGLDPRPSP
jgi:hypothetical protein